MRFLVMLALCISTVCLAAEGKFGAVVLLQTDSQLQAKRVEAREMADYMKAIQAAMVNNLRTHQPPRSAGFVVVAVREGGATKVWLDMEPEWPADSSSKLSAAVAGIRPFHVASGDVVFALKLSLDGAGETARNTPMPAAWRKAMAGSKQPLPIEQVVGLAWPRDVSGPERKELAVPAGYEIQKLDVTEGNVLKPKDWFYSHTSNGQSITWTLSKEDSRGGKPYDTGFRIQFFPEAASVLNVPIEKFVSDFIAQKQGATQVIRLCPATREGNSMRRCMEVIEGRFHILYSLIWSDKMNSLVITTFGTPVAGWGAMEPVVNRMNEFTLIGSEFLKAAGKPASSPPSPAAARVEVREDSASAPQAKAAKRSRANEDARECLKHEDMAKLRQCAEKYR